MSQIVMASGIFSLTFSLIIFKPKGITEGIAGALGAILMVAFGLVGMEDIIQVLNETGNILIILLMMMITSIIVDESGFFHWAAVHTIRLSKGNGLRLFINTFIMGTVVTTVISNDATALIITPIVYSFVSVLGLNPLPFLLICTFIADTASISLPVSNLTNLLVYDQLGLSFGNYLLSLALPTLVAILVNIIIFLFLFKKDIPQNFNIEQLKQPKDYVKNQIFFKFSFITLLGIIFGYVIAAWIGIPIVYIAVLGGVILLITGKYLGEIDEKKYFLKFLGVY